MKDLMGIVDDIATEKELQLDTKVFEIFGGLSSVINRLRKEGGRIESHLRELGEFSSAFESGLSKDGPYDYSRTSGYCYARGSDVRHALNAAREANRMAEVKRYETVIKEVNDLIPSLKSRLQLFGEANKAPYEFLLAQIPRGNGFDAIIHGSLIQILSQYQTFVKDLLIGTFDKKTVIDIENKTDAAFEEHVKLGILYMFNGELPSAQHQFVQAKAKLDTCTLHDSLRDISSNIRQAYEILKLPYSIIRSAQEFEKG